MAINSGYKTIEDINKETSDSKDFKFQSRCVKEVNEKEIYVFVIGETARYSNFSINRYDRNTSPLLSKTMGLNSFLDVYSEANLTLTSLPILLSRSTAKNFNVYLKEKTVVDAFKEAGFSTYWIANQSLGTPLIHRIVQNTTDHYFATKDFDSVDNFDENLWNYLDSILAKKEKKQ